ncbi:hypothetical protein OAC63_05005 [Amylibacter sp.]|nr:hypothetical protein [Amylibacter sp.]
MNQYGPAFWQSPSSLVRPTKDYFTAKGGRDHVSALSVFNDVKWLLHLNHLKIRLEPIPQLAPEHSFEHGQTSKIAGQYFHDDVEPLITYNPLVMGKPLDFISMLAHELMHAKLEPHVETLPGGEGAHELATDLHCIIHGFGLIQLQGAADAGWSGYMTQNTRAFATAIFTDLTESQNLIIGNLRGREAKLMKKATKALRNWQPELDGIKATLK